MPRILFCRADFDLASLYISAYTSLSVQEALNLRQPVTDLHASKATYQNFLEALTLNPEIVVFTGHGDPDAIGGQNNEALVVACQNDQLLAQKTVCTWACSTAQKLGPSAKEKTCFAYAGFQADLVFITKENFISNPLEDPYAKAFFEPLIAFLSIILRGGTSKEAYETLISNYNQWINHWKQSTDPMSVPILTWLYWNRDNFIVITAEGIYRAPARPKLIPLLMLPLGFLAILARPK